jgi:Mg-chelatase subunit ChlD
MPLTLVHLLPRRTHSVLLSRPLASLVLGAQLLTCLPGVALARSPAPDWPGAAPTTLPSPQTKAQAFGPVTTRPGFQAPSATHCARDIVTTEIPGAPPRQERRERELWPESVGKLVAPRVAAAPARSDAPAAAISELAESSVVADKAALSKRSAGASAETARVRDSNVAPPRSEPVTAGVIDDNAQFAEYLGFRRRTPVAHLERDVSERYLLQVRDARGRSVADAEVRVQSPRGQAMWARTDAGGQAWIAPNSFDTSRASTYQVSVRKPDGSGFQQATAFLQRGQQSAVDITLDAVAPQRAQLDLVFLVDATGSMDDEIGKLKATLQTIATELAQLPAQPDLCFALVAYRDKQDEFLLRSHDFTNNLNAFQGVLNKLQALGGGDYPEAMSEALHHTVHQLSWRGHGATRMVFLLADAPPHLDYGGPRYDEDMMAALGKGIKVFGVGASGLDKQGEYIQRQIAQYTGGKFVFLTYDKAEDPSSGPGRETVHDVKNYSVDTLDRLIVRLVRDDLAKLGSS